MPGLALAVWQLGAAVPLLVVLGRAVRLAAASPWLSFLVLGGPSSLRRSSGLSRKRGGVWHPPRRQNSAHASSVPSSRAPTARPVEQVIASTLRSLCCSGELGQAGQG